MQVSGVKPTTITSKELLERFKNGERPEFENNNDKMQGELDALAQQYKQSMTVENKAILLAKEREMLYGELLHPERTLARNYEKISAIMPKEFTPQETEDTLRLFNVTGITRIERLGGAYKPKTLKENVETLKDVYSLFDETTKSGNRGRNYIITALSSIEERHPDLKPLVQTTFDELSEVTKDNTLRESIYSKGEIDEPATLKSLRENPNQDYLFRNLILKGSAKNEKITEFVTQTLKSEQTKPDIMRTAILGAGRYRSDENFEIIRDIALDAKEKDVRKREFALQSTALYVKDKPQEVNRVLKQVSHEKSVFAPLGQILLDKTTGNYHGQKDREIKYSKLTKKQADRFKKLYNRYYVSDVALNTRQENVCQLNTLMFRKQLGRFVNAGRHYLIQSDTYTKQAPDSVAERYFFANSGIYNSGDYMDAFDGISAEKYNMMNPYRVGSANHQNQMAHENGHSVHEMFDKKDMKTLTRLYNKASREGRVLDYYAAANKYEYFAQGCDAMASVYKPHKDIITNNPLAHTVFELMDRDTDLYKFIKTVLKKYH